MAANEFENLARAAFSGVEFPIESMTLMGSGRHHVHVYAHVHGGDPEKLGRNLYEVEMRCCFLTSATRYNTTDQPLWPSRLQLLRQLFEAQTTADLVIPTVGKIKAFCTNWTQEMSGKVLNGEKATFRFLEDQSSAFLLDRLISVTSTSVQSAALNLKALKDKAMAEQALPETEGDIFDNIQALANTLFAVRDQIELGALLFEERCAMLANLCREAEKTSDFFQDPSNWPMLDATKDLQAAAIALGESTSGPGVEFAFYEVRVQSTIGEVATAIFGSTERAMELLQLNAIENAFDIRPGTRIRYLADTTVAAA